MFWISFYLREYTHEEDALHNLIRKAYEVDNFAELWLFDFMHGARVRVGRYSELLLRRPIWRTYMDFLKDSYYNPDRPE